MNTDNKDCLLFQITINKLHTTEGVKTQQAEKNTVSVNGFKMV